jgi:hypothetical protein
MTGPIRNQERRLVPRQTSRANSIAMIADADAMNNSPQWYF